MDRNQLRKDLERDEERRRSAYKDSEGFLTIGVGRLIDAKRNGGLSEQEIDFLLDNDIETVLTELERSLPWLYELSEPHQRALCNMAFNLGVPRLLGFRKMLRALRAGDFSAAAHEALDSQWARQVGARAQRIAAVLRQG